MTETTGWLHNLIGLTLFLLASSGCGTAGGEGDDLQASPSPFVHDGALYGVIRDELDVQFVVRARIVRP